LGTETRGDTNKDGALELLEKFIPQLCDMFKEVQEVNSSSPEAPNPYFFRQKVDAFQRWARARRTRMDNETVLILADIAWCLSCK
jgi:hypothetical protein